MNFERQNFLFKIYFKSLDLCRGHVEERLWTSIIYLRIHAQFAEHMNMLLKLWEGSSLVNTCLGVNMSHFDFWAKKLYTSLFQVVHSRRYHLPLYSVDKIFQTYLGFCVYTAAFQFQRGSVLESPFFPTYA